MKVLISAPYLINEFEPFRHIFENEGIEFDIYPVKERMEAEELLPIIEQYSGVICGDDRYVPSVIDKATNLKVIVKWGTGIDSIDKEYANAKGIKVCNTPDAFTEPVSDSILALILAFTRRLFISDRLMKNGQWKKAFGISMSELTIGIVGFGNIGKATARKLKAFNCKVLVNDVKTITNSEQATYGVTSVPLDALLKSSDYVSLSTDLNPTSAHIINENTLEMCKDGAFLINCARGPLVEEKALIKALKQNKLAGAGLDVFEDEPLPNDSPLRSMDNVILSSHNVNASPKHWSFIHTNSIKMLLENLK